MIKEIHSFSACQDFITAMANDPEHSDPHYLYDPDTLNKAFIKKDQKAFITEHAGKTDGLYVWLFLPEEKYVEMIIGFTAYQKSFIEMFTYVKEHFPGCLIDLVINPDNHEMRDYLTDAGAVFDTEQQKMVRPKQANHPSEQQIELLSPKWETQYRTIHDDNTYWTAERIIASSKFRTFIAIADQRVIGYLDVTCGYEENEIYALYVIPEYRNQGYETALLDQAYTTDLMVLVNVDDTDEIRIYADAGFSVVPHQNSIYAAILS